MTWLIPSITAKAFGTALLSFVYYYLYIIDHQKYLIIWTVSWSVYCIRFIFLFWMIMVPGSEIMLIGDQLASFFSGVLLLWGTYAFVGKKLPRIWLYSSCMWIMMDHYQRVVKVFVFFNINTNIYVPCNCIYLDGINLNTVKRNSMFCKKNNRRIVCIMGNT